MKVDITSTITIYMKDPETNDLVKAAITKLDKLLERDRLADERDQQAGEVATGLNKAAEDLTAAASGSPAPAG